MSQSHPAYMPKIIGHRGACGHAPENTIASIDAAAKLGVGAIEFDATVDADGTARVHHDSDVERCTNGAGPIILMASKDVDGLDAGSWFDPQFKGEGIPRLDTALRRVMGHAMKLNLEIKPSLGWEEPTARAVADALEQVWTPDAPLLVSSMNTLALDTFHHLMPEITLGLITYAIPENWLQRMERHRCNALHCHHAFVTRQLVDEIHVSGHRLHVYTVNAPERAKQLYAMGVDAVFTDYPDRLHDAANTP